MLSLSSLLVPRSELLSPTAIERPPLSLALAALAHPAQTAVVRPPAATTAMPPPVRAQQLPQGWSSPSPPPLAPLSDSEEESDLEDIPPLLEESPRSSSMDDACPWSLVDEPMQARRGWVGHGWTQGWGCDQ